MNQQADASCPVVLTLAGLDPSGGAGIAADLKTFGAHNCYGMSVATAVTVQSTAHAYSIHPLEPRVIESSVQVLLENTRVDAFKIGMLANRANAEVVGAILAAHPHIPSVLDPVIFATSGLELIDQDGLDYLRERLLRQATVITPNLDEAAALTGLKVASVETMKAAARKLVELGARAVVVTGGHLEKPCDVFYDGTEIQSFVGERAKPNNVHGAGCAFSSAIAANLALGRHLADAVMLAKVYVAEAIRKAYAVGAGRRPLNHLYRMQQPTRLIDPCAAVYEPVS